MRAVLDEFAELLLDAIAGGASIGFPSSVSHDEARAFWGGICEDVERGSRVLVAAIEENRIIGCAHIDCNTLPNGRHRAEVSKVLVHRSARGRGIATAMMGEIESAARARGLTLLVLDTERGSRAEEMYERLGYRRAGQIPGYATGPNGDLVDSVIFYKALK